MLHLAIAARPLAVAVASTAALTYICLSCRGVVRAAFPLVMLDRLLLQRLGEVQATRTRFDDPSMILDSLSAAVQYEGLGTGIALGLAYLRNFDAETPDGRYPLNDDDLFALVQGYETTPGTEKRFEAHREYIDIQYVASGGERILYTPVDRLEVETPYSEAGDVVFFREPGVSSSLLLRPGEFAIFYPGDAHKPGCMAGGRDRVKKVVVKVRL